MLSAVILKALNDAKRKELKALLHSRSVISVPSAADFVKLLSALIRSELPDFSRPGKDVTLYREIAHLGGRCRLAELTDNAKLLRGISKNPLACSMT